MLLRTRMSPEGERDIIVEEVEALLGLGFRHIDRDQILEGLRVAQAGSPLSDWKRWSEMPLSFVIDELFYLGVP